MNVTEVHSFLILAGQLHFGRADRLLHLSQPALTKQIRCLEEELGRPVLVRGARSTKLSLLGRSFLEDARVLVQDWDNLVAYSRRISRGESGRLRLGFGFHTCEVVPAPSSCFNAPNAAAAFRAIRHFGFKSVLWKKSR